MPKILLNQSMCQRINEVLINPQFLSSGQGVPNQTNKCRCPVQWRFYFNKSRRLFWWKCHCSFLSINCHWCQSNSLPAEVWFRFIFRHTLFDEIANFFYSWLQYIYINVIHSLQELESNFIQYTAFVMSVGWSSLLILINVRRNLLPLEGPIRVNCQSRSLSR